MFLRDRKKYQRRCKRQRDPEIEKSITEIEKSFRDREICKTQYMEKYQRQRNMHKRNR